MDSVSKYKTIIRERLDHPKALHQREWSMVAQALEHGSTWAKEHTKEDDCDFYALGHEVVTHPNPNASAQEKEEFKTLAVQQIHIRCKQYLLMTAIQMGHIDQVRKMIASSTIDLDEPYYDQNTPLMEAVLRNNTEIADLLIQAGCDPARLHVRTGESCLEMLQNKKNTEKMHNLLQKALHDRYGPYCNTAHFSYEHDAFIAIAQHLFPQADSGGICHGFALMGMQAARTGNVLKLQARLAQLDRLWQERHEDSTEEKAAALILQLQEHQNDPDIQDLFIFFQGMHACMTFLQELFTVDPSLVTQQSHDFITSILSLVGSVELEQLGKTSNITNFVGTYTQEQLTAHFVSLREAVLQPPSITTPIMMTLASFNPNLAIASPGHAPVPCPQPHAQSVIYDPKQDVWICFDADRIETRWIHDPRDLSIWLSHGFPHTSTTCPIITRCFVTDTHENSALASERIQSWQHSPSYQCLHTYDLETAKKLWFYCYFDCPEVLNEFLQKGVPVDTCSRDESTLLMGAIYRGHQKSVIFLLEHGADPFITNRAHLSPLMLACHASHPRMLQILIENGRVQITSEVLPSMPVLAFLACIGNQNLISFALEQGANIHWKDPNGKNLIDYALQENQLETAVFFIEKGLGTDEQRKHVLDRAIAANNQALISRLQT